MDSSEPDIITKPFSVHLGIAGLNTMKSMNSSEVQR